MALGDTAMIDDPFGRLQRAWRHPTVG